MRHQARQPLPSLEEPPPGTACEHCGRELRIEGFCAACFELHLQEKERRLQLELEEARRRARTWKLDRAMSL